MARLIFVFALTPRAGTRHHVYLVPRDDSNVERRIEQLVPEVNRVVASGPDGLDTGPSFIVAWQTVQQRTTGRSGPEWVCLASLSPCSLEPTEQAREFLAEKLGELDRIVTHRQWGDAGKLYEQVPELLSWQEEAEKLIRSNPLVAPAASAPVARPQRLPALLRLFTLLILTCLAVSLILVMACTDDWRKWVKWPPRKDDPWLGLAEAVGVPKNQSENNLKQEILTKLQLLFECDERGTSSAESPEPRIEKLLQAFEKAMGRRGTEKLDTLSRSPLLRKELKSLFRDGNFDPTGLVDWDSEGDAQFWQSLPARKLYELHNSLVESTKAGWPREPWDIQQLGEEGQKILKLKEQWPQYNQIIKVLHEYTSAVSHNYSEATPSDPAPDDERQRQHSRNFYLSSEKDFLKRMRKLLENVCLACQTLEQVCGVEQNGALGTHQQRHTAHTTNPKCNDAIECVQVAVRVLTCKGPNREGSILADVIRRMKDVPEPPKEPLRAVEALQKLVEKWAEIVKSE